MPADVDGLLRCLLAERLLEAPDEALAARRLADAANVQARALVRAPLLHPFGRADVDRVLAGDPAHFAPATEGWRLASDYRAALARHDDAPPEYSPRLSTAARIALYPWQQLAIERWRHAGRRGIVAAITGAGKTDLGIAAIEAHLRRPSARAVVLVPSIELMHQWRTRLTQSFFVTVGAVGDGHADSLRDHAVVVFVAKSAAESLSGEIARCGAPNDALLVADECHRYGARSYARALTGPFGATLGLSATPERDHDGGMERYVFPALGPVIFSYDHDRAVAEKVVADFRVLFVGVAFAPVEREKHAELTHGIAKTYGALCSAYPFLKQAKPFVEAVKVLAGRDEDELALRWLSLVSERRRLLCNARQRHDFVAWLGHRQELEGRQMLVFHESIDDAEALATALDAAGVPARAHHSELAPFERAAVLGAFADGRVQAIVSPHTLDEGIDVPDAALAVIAAGSRVKRQSIQRIGRVLRRTPRKQQARVVKVFVRGAEDDPGSAQPDRFSREMLENGRASVAFWPEEGECVCAFLRAAQ